MRGRYLRENSMYCCLPLFSDSKDLSFLVEPTYGALRCEYSTSEHIQYRLCGCEACYTLRTPRLIAPMTPRETHYSSRNASISRTQRQLCPKWVRSKSRHVFARSRYFQQTPAIAPRSCKSNIMVGKDASFSMNLISTSTVTQGIFAASR